MLASAFFFLLVLRLIQLDINTHINYAQNNNHLTCNKNVWKLELFVLHAGKFMSQDFKN